ncbi:MAG: GAF domain-containing protein, partial [Chloroflexaceae bacterium]
MTTPATPATRGSGPSLMKLVQHIPEARRWRRQADALIVIGRQFELMAQERGVEAHIALGTLRFSLFHLHQGRIAQLAPLCRSVTVYGEADVAPPTIPHVTFAPMPAGSPLSQEWFLVVDSPVFWGSMISRVSMDRANSAARRYQFEGVLTAEERVVSRASLLLSLARGQAPPETPRRDPVANAARWARIAYALASHSEAQRLKLVDCLGELPELQSLLAEASLEYDQMVPLAMDALRRFCGTVGELLYRYTDGALTPVAWSAASPPPPHSLAEGLVGQAFQQGRLTMQPLVPTDLEYALLGGAASAIAIPISVRGQPWGVLLIGQAEPDPHEAEGLARAVSLATLLEQLIETRGGAVDQAGLRSPMPATLADTSPLPEAGRQPATPAVAPGAMGPGPAAPSGPGSAPTAAPFGPGSAPTPAAAPFGPGSAPTAAPFGPGSAPTPTAAPFGPGSAPTPAAAPFGPGSAPTAAPFGPGSAPTPTAAPFGPGSAP